MLARDELELTVEESDRPASMEGIDFIALSIKLLRIAPLITSTASLTFARDQHIFFRAWLHPPYRSEANILLPRWFAHFLKGGFPFILVFYPGTAALAIANLCVGKGTDEYSKASLWYWGGFLGTVGHFFFATWAIRLLRAVSRDESKGKSTENLRRWLDMNYWRSISVDMGGWLCYLVAVLMVM